MKTKQEQALEMAGNGYSMQRISKILGVSQRQVVRYVLTAATEQENDEPKTRRRPRKPKPRR